MPRLSAITASLVSLPSRLLLVFGLLATTFAHAQGPAPDKQLLGAWRAAGVLIEFHADGRFEAKIAGTNKPVAGQWQVVDGKHLLTWSDSARPKRINQFSIRGDYLMVVQSAGRVIVHQRVESPPPEAQNQ